MHHTRFTHDDRHALSKPPAKKQLNRSINTNFRETILQQKQKQSAPEIRLGIPVTQALILGAASLTTHVTSDLLLKPKLDTRGLQYEFPVK